VVILFGRLRIVGSKRGKSYQYGDDVPKEYQHAVRLDEREGHTLVISKALYGLRTSGLRWHERHIALSFHCVREAIATKSIAFYHVDEVRNPADILGKHWDYKQVWKLLCPTQLDDYSHSGRPPNEYKNVKITDYPRSQSLVSDGSETLRSLAR
jgi:hypothetical protein